jgi:hypothetical protein
MIAAGVMMSAMGTAHAAAADPAASDLVEKIQAALYRGQTAQAVLAAQTRLSEFPHDAEARFSLGTVQFLQAVEQLGQSLYRYGLKSSDRPYDFALVQLPIVRLPVPDNPNPDKVTYKAFRDILDTFARNLQTADATLGKIASDRVDLALNIGLIRLDLNGDGQGSEDEALWKIFQVVFELPWLSELLTKDLLVDFDASDIPWLRAYCHLLTAIAEFPLAYDWRIAFETTFGSLFPSADLPFNNTFEKVWRTELDQLNKQENPPLKTADDCFKYYPTFERRDDRLCQLLNRRDSASFIDQIASVHLVQWPVVEPERLRSVLEHLETMVVLSRDNWKRILAETDDHNEWIPNPRQTGALSRVSLMVVNQQRVDGWMQFLDEFEAILKGRKLVPHWRFDQGVNMRRFFLEPADFDIVLLVHGSGAVPYLEHGELTTEQTWTQISSIFGGSFLLYVMWFN